MLIKRLYRLFALTIIIAMMLPTSMVQARSSQQADQPNCPPYNPRFADDVTFLSQLPPECWSAYYQSSSRPEQPSFRTPPSPQFTGGPDAYGYTWDDTITSSWIDTSGGTNTGLSGWGGVTGPVALPFTFRYYDNEYSSLYITSYGYIAFDNSPNWWAQDYIPHPDQPNNVIAPFWTPTYIPAGAWVHYQSGGTAPNRYFVVEWHNVSGGPASDPDTGDENYLFEVILYENGNIDFQYSTMYVNNIWWCFSIGIENSTGLDGLTYRDLCSGYPPSFLTVRFFRPATGSFIDVTTIYWAQNFIERLFNAGITGGCSLNPLKYCPETTVTRAQMAVFLEKGVHYPTAFTAPDVAPTFNDTVGHWAEDWIEALKNDGITAGCGSGNYCPEAPVTRAQMAIFLLRAKHGPNYTPPNATGIFTDVPLGYWAADWIEQLAAEGITGGCGTGVYCPDASVTRAQMAVFLVKTFNLP